MGRHYPFHNEQGPIPGRACYRSHNSANWNGIFERKAVIRRDNRRLIHVRKSNRNGDELQGSGNLIIRRVVCQLQGQNVLGHLFKIKRWQRTTRSAAEIGSNWNGDEPTR